MLGIRYHRLICRQVFLKVSELIDKYKDSQQGETERQRKR